jgi:hypothetical protein
VKYKKTRVSIKDLCNDRRIGNLGALQWNTLWWLKVITFLIAVCILVHEEMTVQNRCYIGSFDTSLDPEKKK